MTCIPEQFVTIAKRIIGELAGIRKGIDAVRDQQERDHQQQKAEYGPPPAPLTVNVSAELREPEEAERDRRTRDDRHHFQQVWLTWAAWLTFVAAAIYAGINYSMWRAMQRTNELATETFRIDERAWLVVDPVTAVPLAPANDRFPASFLCNIYPRNAGKTAATHVQIKALALGGGEELGNNAEQMQRTQDRMLLNKFTEMGTGKPVIVPEGPLPRVIPPASSSPAPVRVGCSAPQILASGTRFIEYVVGRIDYCDQFQVRHWLKFCFFVANARGEVWNCKEGNDEDRNREEAPSLECSKQ
jgi:hypothetical protein